MQRERERKKKVKVIVRGWEVSLECDVCVHIREITWGGGIGRAGPRRAQSACIAVTWCTNHSSFLKHTCTHTHTGKVCTHSIRDGRATTQSHHSNCCSNTSTRSYTPNTLCRRQPLRGNCPRLLMFSRIKLNRSLQGQANFTTLCLYLNKRLTTAIQQLNNKRYNRKKNKNKQR